ncbi:hypothetical protein M419DRAFT_122304, partial [Trichoderma reesei RUT C-30]
MKQENIAEPPEEKLSTNSTTGIFPSQTDKQPQITRKTLTANCPADLGLQRPINRGKINRIRRRRCSFMPDPIMVFLRVQKTE